MDSQAWWANNTNIWLDHTFAFFICIHCFLLLQQPAAKHHFNNNNNIIIIIIFDRSIVIEHGSEFSIGAIFPVNIEHCHSSHIVFFVDMLVKYFKWNVNLECCRLITFFNRFIFYHAVGSRDEWRSERMERRARVWGQIYRSRCAVSNDS